MAPYTLSIMSKKLSSSFKNDVNNIMTQKGVVVDINEDELACSCSGDIFAHYIYTIGDFKYEFKGTIHKWPNTHILSYKVVKTKKNDDLADIKYIRNPVLFNDFKIESVEVSIKEGKINYGYCWIDKYKKNACKLCSDTKTHKCCKSHEKSNKHINNVVKRNKLYADTIEDTTKLNNDVCNLIVSYIF